MDDAAENQPNDLTHSDLSTIEYLLKSRLVERFGAIQEDRAFSKKGRNVGNAKKYVSEARTLRRVLRLRGRQSYVPLREMTGGADWVSADSVDLGAAGRVAEVAEAIHEAGDVATEDLSRHSSHESVPGNSGDDQ